MATIYRNTLYSGTISEYKVEIFDKKTYSGIIEKPSGSLILVTLILYHSVERTDKTNVFYGKNVKENKSIEAIYMFDSMLSKLKKTAEIKYNLMKFISSHIVIILLNNKISEAKSFSIRKEQPDRFLWKKINIIAYRPEDIILIIGSPKNIEEISRLPRFQILCANTYNS